ncbi:hypothetical protein KCP75_20085 [Salmonella enterica subsp. enterica]|nr:hypothetical protein KCP75_20085 [Salmonella enterica subsp. enterica]
MAYKEGKTNVRLLCQHLKLLRSRFGETFYKLRRRDYRAFPCSTALMASLNSMRLLSWQDFASLLKPRFEDSHQVDIL